MKKHYKEEILNLIKKCACFYQTSPKTWKLETSINVSDPDLIATLRKFFTED